VSARRCQVELFAWNIFRAIKRLLEAAVMRLLLAGYTRHFRDAILECRCSMPLALPGVEHMRIAPAIAGKYHSITQQLQTSCDSYFSMPGIFSLYFWTKTEPSYAQSHVQLGRSFQCRPAGNFVGDPSRINPMCLLYNPFW
jgi:hypothetical protein